MKEGQILALVSGPRLLKPKFILVFGRGGMEMEVRDSRKERN